MMTREAKTLVQTSKLVFNPIYQIEGCSLSSNTEMSTQTVALYEEILKLYSAGLDELPLKERIHFLRRAFRSTNQQSYADEITNWTISRTIPAIRRRSRILANVVKKGRAYPSVTFKLTKNRRINSRNALLTKKPELQFFRRYLMDLFQAHSSGLHLTMLKDEWPGIINILKRVDFDHLFVDVEVLEKISSFAVNSVIFLKHLDVDPDLDRRFVGYLRGHYLEDNLVLSKDLSDRDYTSFVYNLTHIVIAESRFYQEWVTAHQWIGDFFAQNIDEIIARCSHDVIAEVGLSLKLLRLTEKYSDQCYKITDNILKTYDFQAALSPENLAKKEHTNVVIMLLFAHVDTWASGPLID